MQLDLGGHPTHTRALSITLGWRDDGKLAAEGNLVDLRKRGFCPVGSALQGAGIIHQMGIAAVIDPRLLVLESIEALPQVVAFEASPATRGESCRDIMGGVGRLAGLRLDDGAGEHLRRALGGAAGCSHILVLAQLVCSTVSWLASSGRLATALPPEAVHRRALRRDLVLDGSELDDGRLAIGIQLSDLFQAPGAAESRPIDLLAEQSELRVQLTLNGWPATIDEAKGSRRRRSATDFTAAPWTEPSGIAALRGLSLGKGATRELLRVLADDPPLLDSMLMLSPALIQCRASFPDKWLNVAATTPGHPGLIGIPESCYMWRRGGALEAIRREREER
jgi:hypothetical protein